MTVEALLEQLKKERMDAVTQIPVCRMKAWRALLYGDHEVAKLLQQMIDDYKIKFERLNIVIDEIEKRVS